jgi:S1-C subfamily serine protease
VAVTLARFYVPGKSIATASGSRPFFRGLRVDWTSILVQQPRAILQRIPAGVAVGEVQPNTPATVALLKPGEIITHVGGRPVNSPAAFYREVQGRDGPVELTLVPGDPSQKPPKVTLTP